jgi:hypothetical protein
VVRERLELSRPVCRTGALPLGHPTKDPGSAGILACLPLRHTRASCWIRTSAADLQDRSHNQLDQRSSGSGETRTRGLRFRRATLLIHLSYGAVFKSADGRTRTRIDLFRRQAPGPFGHVRKLRSQGSNLESLGSKPSVLPVTPLRNVSGWGRIRTGYLWGFKPALFLMSFPTQSISDCGFRIAECRLAPRRNMVPRFNPQSEIRNPQSAWWRLWVSNPSIGFAGPACRQQHLVPIFKVGVPRVELGLSCSQGRRLPVKP